MLALWAEAAASADRVALEATPRPEALPAGKARRAGVQTPAPSDETLSRLLRMRSRLRHLQVDTRWIDGHEITETFTATMGRGRLEGRGHIDWSSPETRHWARVRVFEADVREFLHVCDVRFDGRIEAAATGELELQWQGMRFRQMRSTMKGAGRLELSPGSVGSTRLLDNIARFSGLDELRVLKFDRGLVEGTIERGIVKVTQFELENRDVRLRGVGTVELETGKLEARFDLWVRPELGQRSRFPEVRLAAQALSQVVSREEPFVRVPLPVSFGGTLERPVPYLDIPAARALRSAKAFLEEGLTSGGRDRRRHR